MRLHASLALMCAWLVVGTPCALVFGQTPNRPDRGVIAGQVVVLRGKEPEPVVGAKVLGISRRSAIHADLRATTDDKGRFRVERWLDDMWVHVRGQDGKLVGVVEISAAQNEVTIQVQPSVVVKGRLIDALTGQPGRLHHKQSHVN